MFPCGAVNSVVPCLESAIIEMTAFLLQLAVSISGNEIGFRQKVNDLANFRVSQTPAFSSQISADCSTV